MDEVMMNEQNEKRTAIMDECKSSHGKQMGQNNALDVHSSAITSSKTYKKKNTKLNINVHGKTHN